MLDSGPLDGPTNMATDVALLAHARRTGEATLRIYGWDRPTLSLGRHERARTLFDHDSIDRGGIVVVRRPTGGRALWHENEVTYSVTAPVGASTLRESYRAINALLLSALSRLGISATESPRNARTLRPEGTVCFAEPSAGELTVDGAKLVGSAQLREDGALLQHGSILIADDQPRISELRGHAQAQSGALMRAATLTRILGRSVGYDEVRDALISGLAGTLPNTTPILDFDPASLRDDLARLVIAYSDPAWTWRR